ncbi:MAG: hypothetical protein FJ267_12990, partial [Planctomycetes bacterium]|nr:hypothetical protein [Planctomycetota bacterium]
MASIIAGPFMAALVVVWPRPNWTAAARAIDCHYQLQDRTETALDFAQKGMSAEKQLFAELQIADAVSRLESVEAQQVVPYSTPHYLPTAIGAAVLAFILALLPLKNDEAVAGPIQPDEQIVAQAEEIQENLKELEDELSQDIDPELEQLLQELKQKAEELKEPGVDVKEALAKISEMQAAIQSAQSQSSLEQVDQQLHEVGEAMASAKSLEGAGLALAEGKYDKAAKELENIENLEFDRNEARNTAEKLKKAARKSGNGSDGGVSDATAEMAEGIDDDDSDKVRRGAKKLGDRAKKQARRRKIDDLLKAEVASLNEGKDRVNKNSTDKYKKKEKSNNSSENWGMSESGNIDGDPT